MAPPFPLEGSPPLPMEGALPPDLIGTLFRAGPGLSGGISDPGLGGAGSVGGSNPEGPESRDSGGSGVGADAGAGGRAAPGALHAVELRDGVAVSYATRPSVADEGVFWHAGSLLALPEAGLPLRYDRFLGPEEFGGDLRVPIASHVRRVAADGSRILFSVDDGSWEGGSTDGAGETEFDGDVFLRIGEWDAAGDLQTAQAIALERATWQHDIGVTAGHVVFIESPTQKFRYCVIASSPCPTGGCPGPRAGSGWSSAAETDQPCSGSVSRCVSSPMSWGPGRKVNGPGREREPCTSSWSCSYAAPEPGQPVDHTSFGGRARGHRPEPDRRRDGRARTVAYRWSPAGANDARRPLRRVPEDRRRMRRCGLPIRLLRRDVPDRPVGDGCGEDMDQSRREVSGSCASISSVTRSPRGIPETGVERASRSSCERPTATPTTKAGS